MEKRVLLLHAVDMTRTARIDLLSKMQNGTMAARMFYAEFLAREQKAFLRPIARPQLLQQQPVEHLWNDRDLWAWAAAWTLREMHDKDDPQPAPVCGMCGQITGSTCGECNGPMCNMCVQEMETKQLCNQGPCWRCHQETAKQVQRQQARSRVRTQSHPYESNSKQ